MIRPLHLILALIALVAIALPLAVVLCAPPLPPPAAKIVLPKRVVAKTELPPVEPIELVDLAPQDARAFNAGVPFAKGPIPPARAFAFRGTPEDRARATDCLAAAVYYEAGDDAVGERAVAQVVLNRLRHPAFPKTVCGVVFQGAERSTGCQFTFTCDGALARTPPGAAWSRARTIAAAALNGAVVRKVGLATHYHTDWVVPYWSASLDKIAEVHTHLFFRWSGWWGTPPAFDRGQTGSEPAVAKIAALSDAHRTGTALSGADGAMLGAIAIAAAGALPPPVPSDPNAFFVRLDAKQADTFAALAMVACADRPQCRFMGWLDATRMPADLPMDDGQIMAMSFSYIRDRTINLDRTLWNCTEFQARTPCMKRPYTRPAPRPTIAPQLLTPNLREPAGLEGVRRKGDQPVAPPPTVTTKPQPSG